jgi:hypothetical protein
VTHATTEETVAWGVGADALALVGVTAGLFALAVGYWASGWREPW